MNKPAPPPAAILIKVVREAARVTIPEAAKAAGISVARWSQIENGYETRDGEAKPVWARAGTLAFMAKALGIPAGRLEAEGERPDAAAVLREILRSGRPPSLQYPDREKDAIAADVWEKNRDSHGEVFQGEEGLAVLRGVVEFRWDHRQRGTGEARARRAG